MIEIDSNNNIKLTRGDTCKIKINLTDADGKEYVPQDGDSLRFAMAPSYDGRVILKKNISMNTLLLTIDPADTKKLSFGQYVYDIQFTSASGDVSTIAIGSLHITKEVA